GGTDIRDSGGCAGGMGVVRRLRSEEPVVTAGADATGRSEVSQRPGPIWSGSSHLLEPPDPLLDRGMRVEQLLERAHALALDPRRLVQPQVRRRVVCRTH